MPERQKSYELYSAGEKPAPMTCSLFPENYWVLQEEADVRMARAFASQSKANRLFSRYINRKRRFVGSSEDEIRLELILRCGWAYFIADPECEAWWAAASMFDLFILATLNGRANRHSQGRGHAHATSQQLDAAKKILAA